MCVKEKGEIKGCGEGEEGRRRGGEGRKEVEGREGVTFFKCYLT